MISGFGIKGSSGVTLLTTGIKTPLKKRFYKKLYYFHEITIKQFPNIFMNQYYSVTLCI